MNRRLSCGKKRYANEESANFALQYLKEGKAARKELRAYRCPYCRYWHLTSKPMRKKAR